MANDFSDGLHALESLFSRLRRERGSCAGCEEAPYEIVRSTLTAQQQRIEALEAALSELQKASEQAIYGSHGNAFLPGQLSRYTRAHASADEALNEATQTQHNDPFDPIDPHSST